MAAKIRLVINFGKTKYMQVYLSPESRAVVVLESKRLLLKFVCIFPPLLHLYTFLRSSLCHLSLTHIHTDMFTSSSRLSVFHITIAVIMTAQICLFEFIAYFLHYYIKLFQFYKPTKSLNTVLCNLLLQ